MKIEGEVRRFSRELLVTPPLLERWLDPASPSGRPSYGQRIATFLSPSEFLSVRSAFERALKGRTLPWEAGVALLRACITGKAPRRAGGAACVEATARRNPPLEAHPPARRMKGGGDPASRTEGASPKSK